jgi:ketosteroid isomerase-like protein
MRRFSLVPLALVIALPLAAAPDNTAAVKKELEAGFSKMMAAFQKHDLEGVAAYAADDYQGDDGMGHKLNKAQMKAMMKQYMDETKKVNSAKFSIANLKVNGNAAMGKTTTTLDMNVVDAQGQLGKKGLSHHLVMTEFNNGTWTKTAKGWKVSKESPAGPPKMMVDGKPFNPQMPPPPKKK